MKGAVCQPGDQFKHMDGEWKNVDSVHHGDPYVSEDFGSTVYRRSTVQKEPNWSKAPGYITHYDPEFEAFVFKTGGAFFHYESKEDCLIRLTVDRTFIDKLIPRGQQEQSANAPDEWPSETIESVLNDAFSTGHGFMKVSHVKPSEVLYSIESHEQDEVNAIHDAILSLPEGHDLASWIYAQCYKKERAI